MKENEARDIIGMLKAATGGKQTDQTADDFWTESLLSLDATLATQAVLAGIRTWKWFPSWAEFREAYKAQERLREPSGEQRFDMPKPSKVPLWIRRWTAARFLYERFGRDQDMRPFPEQKEFIDPLTKEWMPDDEWAKEAEHVTDADVWRAVG